MMNFILALLIGLGAYSVVFLASLLIKMLIKKENFKTLFIDFDNILRFGTFLVLYLIFLLIIYLAYSSAAILTFITLSIATSLVTILLPFKSLINKLKNKQFKEINYFHLVGYCGAVLILILEVTAFSNNTARQDDNALNVPFTSALITENDGELKENTLVFDHQRGYLILDNQEHNIKSIYFDFSSEVETRIQIDVYTYYGENTFGFRKDYKFNPNYNDFEYFDLSEYKDSDYLKFQFVIDETNLRNSAEVSPITLHQMVINKAQPFIFNVARFVLLIAAFSLILLVIYKGKALVFKEIDNIAIVEKIILMLCGVGLIYIIINALICFPTHFVSVDKISGDNNAIYYQLFDAFRKGQVHLDSTFGISNLQELANPYEPSTRNFGYLWDHAYYNGKYYCYYGAAPVILMMFPIYFISGMKYVPSILLTLEIGTLFSILAFILAALGLVRLTLKKINLPTLIFVLVGAIFTSLLFGNTIYKVGDFNEGIYRIPYAYGLGFLFLMFTMLFKAYHNSKLRILYLGIAGLSVVLMMASRPTLIFAALLAIPLLIKIVLDKYPLKQKIIDLIPMVSVVLVGAVIICIYNYVRFDSIFEFGQTYQLTLTDNTKLAYSKDGILPTLSQYYIMPPSFNAKMFPFIDFGYGDFVAKYHVYNAGSIGLFFFPMLWSAFLIPFIFDKNDDLFMRIVHYASPFIVFFLAFTTYCFAGVCPRYVVELTAVATLFSVVPILKLFAMAYENKKMSSLVVLIVVVSLSSFMGFNLLFSGFDGWKEADQHGLLEVMRSIFNQYNI